jgi:hypothetical protein
MDVRERGVLAASGVALVASAAAMGALDSPHRHVPAFLAVYAVAFGLAASQRRNPTGRVALWGLLIVAIAARVAVLPPVSPLTSIATCGKGAWFSAARTRS